MEKTPRGIVIRDVWAEKGRREGCRWRARVWDPVAKKYLSASFDERLEALAWAKGKLPRLRVGVETAQSTSLETVGAEYVQELMDRQRNPGHIAEVQRVIASAVESGARLISDKGFHSQVRHWWRNLKARATHTDKTGKEVVRRKKVFELAASTRNRYLIHLKAVTAYALRRRLVLHDPLIGMAGVEPEDFIKPTFTIAELRSIIVNNRPQRIPFGSGLL